MGTIYRNGKVNTIIKNGKIYGYASGGGGTEILSGTTDPTFSQGSNGQIYLKYEKAPSLPDGGQFVEYLQSSGTQYINTGIYATQDIDAIVKSDRISGTPGCALGVRTGSFSGMSKTMYFGGHTDYTYGISVIKTNSSSSGTVTNVQGVTTRRTKTIKNKNGLYVYSSTIDEQTSYSKTYTQSGTWQSANPLCMFGYYDSGTLKTGGSIRVYRVTILEKDKPIADYLPCLDGNSVACMWDNISQKYVYNDGTGDFTYGSVITISEDDYIYGAYLKVNGTWQDLMGSDINDVGNTSETVTYINMRNITIYKESDMADNGYDNITAISWDGSSAIGNTFYYTNAIDVTNINKIYYDLETKNCYGNGSQAQYTKWNVMIGLRNTPLTARLEGEYGDCGFTVGNQFANSNTNYGTQELDVSNLTGNYYLTVNAHGWNAIISNLRYE